MESILRNSGHALASAIMTELDRLEETPLHGAIHLSYTTKVLSNGIRQCSVQLECQAGCGYLIQAVGAEAYALEQKTATIQALLNDGSQQPSRRYFLGELLLHFPDYMPKTQPTTNQRVRELT